MTTEMTKTESQAPEKVQEEYPTFTPRVDIVETEEEIRLKADLPGADENSVDIDLTGNELTLKATCVLQKPEGYNLVHGEYRSGNYERTFTLGEVVDRENITARVKDGVLSLTLPKVKEVQPRKIEVKAE